jgi:hypothetical protein
LIVAELEIVHERPIKAPALSLEFLMHLRIKIVSVHIDIVPSDGPTEEVLQLPMLWDDTLEGAVSRKRGTEAVQAVAKHEAVKIEEIELH